MANNLNVRQFEANLAKERLEKFPHLRQHAVASFLASVAIASLDMKRLCEARDFGGADEQADLAIAHLEQEIQELASKSLGHTLGGYNFQSD